MSQHIFESDFGFSDPDDADDDDDDDEDDVLDLLSPPPPSTIHRTENEPLEHSQTLGRGTEENTEILDEVEKEIDVGKDKQNPEPPETLPIEAWNDGDEVTIEERAVLLGMATDEERARAISTRRREQEQLQEGVISNVTPITPKVAFDAKKAASKGKKVKAKEPEKQKDSVGKKGKAKEPENQKDSERGPRRSDRQKPSAVPPQPAPSNSCGSRHPLLPISININDPTTETTPDDLPEWIDEALLHFNAMSDDGQWATLLVKWIELERLLGFPKGRVSSFPWCFLYRKLIDNNLTGKVTRTWKSESACATRYLDSPKSPVAQDARNK